MNPTDGNHSLQVTAGSARGTEIALDTDDFLIGRLASADGQLGDDPELSREHARIRSTPDGGVEIEDLGSTNGTYVNDTRVRTATRLQPGDVIEVGQTKLTVVDPAGRAAQPTAFGRVREREPAPPTSAVARERDHARRASEPPSTAPEHQPAAAPAAERVWRAPAPVSGPGWGGRRRRMPRRALAVGVGVLAVAAVAAVVAVAASSGDAAPTPMPAPERLTVARLIEKGSPSTVQINTRGPAFTRRGKTVRASGGTGIVVDAKEGLVLTNAHVVAGQTSVKANMAGGTEVSARVISQAPCEDLAMVSLRPNPPGLVSATLGRSESVRAGVRVTALGYPSAFEARLSARELQASEGIVSTSTGRTSLGPASPAFPDVIQHQAPLNGGNSGGPLFNERGEVIGINTFASARVASQNQNAAISIDRATALLTDLKAGKNSGFVGWQLLPLDGGQLPLRPRTTGRRGGALVVLSVDSGSPADRRKLAFGDSIYEIDGTPVRRFQDVCDIVNSKASGDTIRVQGYHFPPLTLFGARLNPLQSTLLREALRFERTIRLR